MTVLIEQVFEITGRGVFALLRLSESFPFPAGSKAVLAGHEVTVADPAPRVIGADGLPRTDVVVVQLKELMSSQNLEELRGNFVQLEQS